jgi:microcystin degradation protein MlrC
VHGSDSFFTFFEFKELKMEKKRVLIGAISQETNSFNPIRTTLSDFIIRRGAEILEDDRIRVLKGIIKAAKEQDIELVPTLSATARPGGRVLQKVYNDFKEEILQIAGSANIDAVALELHGAMQTDELDDVEGDLLASLRLATRGNLPIAVGLDLHGHITAQMVGSADFITGYKENPHRDNLETGERTLNILLSILKGKIALSTAMGKVPMITRGNDETTEGAVKELWDFARSLQKKHRTIVDISIFNVQHFIDASGLGQTVIVATDNDPETAGEVCKEICERLWKIRDDVIATFPSITETMSYILANPGQRPFVLGDIGDRVAAGAPGDSTAILEYILDQNLPLKAAIPITDPEAVQVAAKAGLGTEITLEVGAGFTPFFHPIKVTGTVVNITPNEGTSKDWYSRTMGKTVVLRVKNISLLLMAKSGTTMFPESFISQGIDINDLDLLVVKSGYHFKIYFSGIARPLSVDTPGLTVFRPGDFPFKRGRPVYPLDRIDYTPDSPLIFVGRNYRARS